MGEDINQHDRERARKRRVAAEIAEDRAEIGEPQLTDEQRAFGERLREECLLDLEAFNAKIFHNSTGLKPFGAVQRDSIAQDQTVILTGGQVAKAEPRAYGKTTRTSNAAMWAVLFGHRRMVPVFSANLDKSRTQIIARWKAELRGNDLLFWMFPELLWPLRCLENKPQRCASQTMYGRLTNTAWNADRIVLPDVPDVPGAGSVLVALPLKSCRGATHTTPSGEVLRPDLCIFDDVQRDEDAGNPATVAKLEELIDHSAMMLGGHSQTMSAIMSCTVRRESDLSETYLRNWYLECNRGAPSTCYGDVIRIREMLVVAGRSDLLDSRMRVAPPVQQAELPNDVEGFYHSVYRVQRSLSPAADQQMAIVLRALRSYREKPTLFVELPSVLNLFIAEQEKRFSPVTVKKRRAAVISVWKLAAVNGICDPPKTDLIRKPKCPRPEPDAFSFEEMDALIAACPIFRGQFYKNGIDRAAFWEAIIRVTYNTALRRSDLLALEWGQVERGKEATYLRTVQRKTGDGVIHRLAPKTIAALDAIATPRRKLVFDFPHRMDTLSNHWRDLLDQAGIDPTNPRNGLQKLRRTSASHLERIHPGAATAHLGHRSADMARKHYLDPKICRAELPMPPELG